MEPPGTPAGAVIRADRYSVGLNPAAVTTDVTSSRRLWARHQGRQRDRARAMPGTGRRSILGAPVARPLMTRGLRPNRSGFRSVLRRGSPPDCRRETVSDLAVPSLSRARR
jgi:hypothetical protein